MVFQPNVLIVGYMVLTLVTWFYMSINIGSFYAESQIKIMVSIHKKYKRYVFLNI